MLSYEMSMTLRQKFGLATQAVFDFLTHHSDNGVIQVVHRRIATETGISEKSVRRSITALCDAGLIQRQYQFRGHRQCANRYRILAFDHIEQPGGHTDDPASAVLSMGGLSDHLVRINNSSSTEEKEVFSAGITAADLRSAKVHPPLPEVLPSGSQKEHESQLVWIWPSPDDPMPLASLGFGGRLNIFQVNRAAAWLVAEFQRLVLARENCERQRLGKKPLESYRDRRLLGWFTTASVALGRPNPPPLDEITNLLRWLFGEHDGVLPFDVVNEFNPTGRCRPKDRKITRLKQVFDNYDQIREMRMGNKPDGLVASAGNHNLARPSVPNLKAKVEELVSRFSAVRTMEPDDFMRNNFRTTFRIMLDRDRRSYDQIKLVVDNLGSPRVQEYLDVSRYQDAYWLRQEFDHAYEIMAAVLTAPTCDSSTVPSKPEAWVTAARTDEQDRFEEFVPDRRHTSPSDQDDDGQVSNDAICSKFGRLADL